MAADETTREALGSIGIQPKRGGEHRALQAHAQAPALAKLADLSADGSRVALLDCEGDRFVLRARGTSTSQAVDVDLPGSADATRLHTVVLSPCGAFACVHGAHNAFYVSLAPSTPHRCARAPQQPPWRSNTHSRSPPAPPADRHPTASSPSNTS